MRLCVSKPWFSWSSQYHLVMIRFYQLCSFKCSLEEIKNFLQFWLFKTFWGPFGKWRSHTSTQIGSFILKTFDNQLILQSNSGIYKSLKLTTRNDDDDHNHFKWRLFYRPMIVATIGKATIPSHDRRLFLELFDWTYFCFILCRGREAYRYPFQFIHQQPNTSNDFRMSESKYKSVPSSLDFWSSIRHCYVSRFYKILLYFEGKTGLLSDIFDSLFRNR